MAKNPPDVLIIGGGVIGLTTAYYLATEGASVLVMEQGDFGREASWAGAGILPPGNPARARSPYDQLRAHSAFLYPTFSERLREQTGIDNGYVRCGGLELAEEEGNLAVEEWRAEGIVFEPLDAVALGRLEPAVAPQPGVAYYLPEMAQLRNPRHLKALLAACRAEGVRVESGCPVFSFERQGDRLAALHTAIGMQVAGRFFVAAGAWTGSLLEQLGWRSGIGPIRGQIALLNTGAPLIRRIVLLGPRYLVPRLDGRVLVGSTEENAGFEKRTTAGAISELLALAGSLVPGLSDAHVEQCWAGLRPGSPDGLPFLGPVPGFTNLFVAAGHFRAGIQLSPATGLVMKELLLGQKLTVPLESFRLDRPVAPRYRPAFPS
jgi:glycine oxidase